MTDHSEPIEAKSRIRHYLRQNAFEVAIYLVSFIALLSILLAVDAFDSVYHWSRGQENWELDEVVLAICVMGAVSLVFVLRRWVREYRDKREILKLSMDLGEALKAAKAADEAKSAFLATLSHELRTPLNTIKGYAELMESGMMGPIDPRYASYARDIRESGEQLLETINGMLDLTRVTSGGLDLRSEVIALRDEVRYSFKQLAEQASAKDIDLKNDVPEDLPIILADRQRIRQVLASLLGNAVKFSAAGTRVEVGASATPESVVVTVRDQGIGMDPKDLSRIVEPFVQLDSDFSREQEGAGLGLALTKRFVELHKGSLEFESAPGQGTTVIVTLPRPEATSDSALTGAAGG